MRNDHKALMLRIEKGLEAHFARDRNQSEQTPVSAAQSTLPQTIASTAPTFARVNSVVSGSPADAAGLQAGDRIQTFAHANWLNHDKLTKVAQIVSQNEGVR